MKIRLHKGLFVLMAVGVFLLGDIKSAFAIPSPDIIINLFSSASHLIIVAIAYLGGMLLLFKQQISSWSSRSGSRVFVLLIVLFAVSIISNILQWARYSDQNDKRLTTNLTRTSKQGGILVQDVNLKTMDMSDQLNHPRGVSTDAFLKLILSNKNLPIFDVREPEEYSVDYIPGSVNVRYPDLELEYKKYFKGHVHVYVFCESGNRSSELVNKFAEKGVQNAYFVIGGHEKWSQENKPVVGPGSEKKLARDTLPYSNKETLLTTDEVMKYYREGDIFFVDARYDTEFNFTHLPSAFQFPLRKLTSDEIPEYMGRIPKGKRAIGACYDKRSCFYAKVIGYKLAQAGIPFLGRYTVPYEFSILPGEEKKSKTTSRFSPLATARGLFQGDVIQSSAALPEKSLLNILYQPLRGILLEIHKLIGNWGLSIILFILLCRIFMAPLNFFSDRSAFRMKQLKGKVEEIREEWSENPQRRSKDIIRLYKENGVYPFSGLAVGVVQIILFLGVYRVMGSLTPEMGESPLVLSGI